MPSHHTSSHSIAVRRYSDGGATSGGERCTERVVATERTATSGSRALTVCSDPNGIVGTSSACTDAAVTILELAGAFPLSGEKAMVSSSGVEDTIFGDGDTFSLVGEAVIVLSFSSEVESLLCMCLHPS